MSDSILNLILRLRKQGSGAKDAADDLDKLKNKSDATKGAMGGMVKGLADVQAGFNMVGQVVAVAGQALDATVGKAMRWGDEMGDLSQLTGTSVEATSEFAATMELLGIKSGDLTKTIKALTDQGIQPTMENIKKLASEYQAIQDPVERNEFLFKRFGKQAGDVAEVLGKTSSELDTFTQAARNSGKVIDEETAAAAERLSVNVAIMQQRFEGLTIAVGNGAIPVLNDAYTGAENLVKGYGAVAITIGLATGAITQNEAATRAAALANGDLAAGFDYTKSYSIELANETEKLREETRLLGDQSVTTASAIDAWTLSMQDSVPAASDLSSAIDHTSVMAAGLSAGLGELTKQTLFNQAAAGLDALASIELARTMGLIDEDAYAAGTAVEELRQKYDTNKDGAISAAEGASQFAREAANLARELNLIPTNINTTISVTKIGDENFGGWTPPAGSGNSSGSGGGETNINGMRAAGGPVMGGGAYIVGEQGPELFVPRQSGTVVANSGGDPGLRAMLQTLPATIARAVRDGIMQAG